VPRPNLRAISGGVRRKRLLAGLALVVAVCAVIAIVAGTSSPSSRGSSGAAGTASGAATVQRRDLVETDTESGTLSYSDPQTVYDRSDGTITWLPSVGQVIKPGGALYDVDGEPVILMDGSTPAYHALGPDDSDGPDVLALNRNLVALGFDASEITVDDIWQPATTVGVELLQASLGESETGSLALGDVVFLPGDQLVSAVDATLGGTGAGGGSAATGSGAASDASTGSERPEPEFVSLTPAAAHPGVGGCQTTTPPDTTTTSSSTTSAASGCPSAAKPTKPAKPAKPRGDRRPGAKRPDHPGGGARHGAGSAPTLAALTALLKVEEAQLKAEAAQLKAQRGASSGSPGGGGKSGSGSSDAGTSSRSSGDSGSSGGSGASAQAILQTTSTRLVVTVDLSASSQSEAAVGEHVTVEMPAGNTVEGKITGVSSVAQSSSDSGSGDGGGSGSGNGGGAGAGGSGGSSSSTIPVTITLRGHHTGAGLDQAAVSVNFAEQRANHVLSVPVTALLATGGGNYAVQESAAPRRLIPVTTGLFAAGYVQISGTGIYPGLQVTDSQG
jgi:hypothetical protein